MDRTFGAWLWVRRAELGADDLARDLMGELGEGTDPPPTTRRPPR